MRLLDLFCCEGGAGMGYHRAGFEVVGVDIMPQPRYPFEFVQADAIEYVREHGHEFDAIHASPPCQAYSITKHSHDKEHPDLLAPTREAILATGKPYIIENVVGAPLIDPLLLCGSMFGLTADDVDGKPLALRRHRLFESSVWMMQMTCDHDPKVTVAGVYGGGRNRTTEKRDAARLGGYTPNSAIRRKLMGMDWATMHGTSQAIPPAYTEWLGAQLLDHLQKEAA
jgi:DNA (cytosine-5)-methyltransferase 1